MVGLGDRVAMLTRQVILRLSGQQACERGPGCRPSRMQPHLRPPPAAPARVGSVRYSHHNITWLDKTSLSALYLHGSTAAAILLHWHGKAPVARMCTATGSCSSLQRAWAAFGSAPCQRRQQSALRAGGTPTGPAHSCTARSAAPAAHMPQHSDIIYTCMTSTRWSGPDCSNWNGECMPMATIRFMLLHAKFLQPVPKFLRMTQMPY